jgi:hypothetical protein
MHADFAKNESSVDLSGLEPREAIAALAKSIWTYLWNSPEWLGPINCENLHRGQYLQTSEKLRSTISPVIDVIRIVPERGASMGYIRNNIDALDFYVTLVGMGYYIGSNQFTISAFTGRDYARQSDRESISDMHLAMLDAYLRPTA